ncbi:MAG: Rap1a/Tai family immunity protein [Chromatiales bacterium]|jgi:hypothetical protein|nr:Rap1a/Tai family immunity protein [Chromatiales bacterium]
MKKSGVFLGWLLVLATAPAVAVDTTNFEVKTSRDLVALCSTSASDPLYHAAMGYCLGYVDGAHDYHLSITSGELLKPIACHGPEVTRQQVVDVFLAWSRNNDSLLDKEAPIHGLMRAVSAKWPCK